MLPERISNDLCSLREGEDRPAIAVRMVFSGEGRKAGHTFHRVMMKSAAKLSYNQAQAAIDGNPDDRSEEHTSELQSLMRISYAVFCLKKKKQTDKTNNVNEK